MKFNFNAQDSGSFWGEVFIAFTAVMAVVSSIATLILIIYGIVYLSERV